MILLIPNDSTNFFDHLRNLNHSIVQIEGICTHGFEAMKHRLGNIAWTAIFQQNEFMVKTSG